MLGIYYAGQPYAGQSAFITTVVLTQFNLVVQDMSHNQLLETTMVLIKVKPTPIGAVVFKPAPSVGRVDRNPSMNIIRPGVISTDTVKTKETIVPGRVSPINVKVKP